MSLLDALWAARAAHLLGVLSFTGATVFRLVVAAPVLRAAGPDTRRDAVRKGDRLAAVSLAVALVAGLVWLLLQSAEIGEADTLADTLSVTRVVLGVTVFGHALLLRFALLLAATAAWRVRLLAAGFAAAAAAAEAGMGHAIASDGVVLPVANALHVVAAGAWLGALLPLLLLVRAAPDAARRAAARFTPLGVVCVLTLIATAIVQGRALIGGLPGLVGTGYGQVAAVKLTLLCVLIAFAAVNHLWLGPAAAAAGPGALVGSIALETAIGVAVVAAAARLSQLDPGAHMQPVWPFAWQPNFAVLWDPDLGREATSGAVLLIAAVLSLALAVLWRRARWPAMALAVAGIAAVWPHLDLFAASAYPTSFYESPTGFSAQSIADGQALFEARCASCHGASGRGDGPVTPPGDIAAVNLTADHIWEHSDGELFWWLRHGIAGPDGALAMPGFPALAEDEVWALIDFVRANAAGASMAARGAWIVPVQAPGLSAVCPDGRTQTNEGLRGTAWRIVVGDGHVSNDGLPAIRLSQSGPPQVNPPTACTDPDGAAQSALALVTGIPPTALAGTQVLVDAGGWLRARGSPGEVSDPSAVARPLEAVLAGHHHH